MSDRSNELRESLKSFGRRRKGLPRLSLALRRDEKGERSGGSSVRRGPGTNTAQLGSEFNGTQFNHFSEINGAGDFGGKKGKDGFGFESGQEIKQIQGGRRRGNEQGDGNSNAEGASQRVPSVSHSRASRRKLELEANSGIGPNAAGSGRRLGRDGSSQFTGSLGVPLEPRNREFKLSGGGASYNDMLMNSLGGGIMRPESFIMTPNANIIPSRSRLGVETGDGRTIANSFFDKPVPLKPVLSQNKRESKKSFGQWTNNGTIIERRSEYSKTRTIYKSMNSQMLAEEVGSDIIKKRKSLSKQSSRSMHRSRGKRKRLNLNLSKNIINGLETGERGGPKSILKRTPINGVKTGKSRKSVRFNEGGSAVFEFPVERNDDQKFQTLLERSNLQSFGNESENTSKMIPSVPNMRSRYKYFQDQRAGNQILNIRDNNESGPKTVQPKKRAHFFNFPRSQRDNLGNGGLSQKFQGGALPPLIEVTEGIRPKSLKEITFEKEEQSDRIGEEMGLDQCTDSIRVAKSERNQRRASRNIIRTIKKSLRNLNNISACFLPNSKENKINVSLVDENNQQVEFDIEFKGNTRINLNDCLASSAEQTPKSHKMIPRSFKDGFRLDSIQKIEEEKNEGPVPIIEEKTTRSRVSQRAKKIGIKPLSLKKIKSRQRRRESLKSMKATSIKTNKSKTLQSSQKLITPIVSKHRQVKTTLSIKNSEPQNSKRLLTSDSGFQNSKLNFSLNIPKGANSRLGESCVTLKPEIDSLYLSTQKEILKDAKQRSTDEAVSELLGKYYGMGFGNAQNEAADFEDYITTRLGNRNWGKFGKLVLKLLYGESVRQEEFNTLSNGFQKMFKKFLVDRYFKDVKEKIKTRLEMIPGVKDLVNESIKGNADIWGLSVEDYSNFFEHFEEYEANTVGDKRYPMITNFLMLLEKKVEEYVRQAQKFQSVLKEERKEDLKQSKFTSKAHSLKHSQSRMGQKREDFSDLKKKSLLGKRNSTFMVQEITTIKQVGDFQKSYTPQESEFKCHQRAIIGRDEGIYVQDENESGANAFMMTPKDSIIPSFGLKATPKQANGTQTNEDKARSQDIRNHTQFKFNSIKNPMCKSSKKSSRFDFQQMTQQITTDRNPGLEIPNSKRTDSNKIERNDIRIFQGSLVELLEEVCPNAMTRNRLKKMLRMFLANFTNDLILSMVQKDYSNRGFMITDEGDGLVDQKVAIELKQVSKDLAEGLRLAVVNGKRTRVDYVQTWRGDINVSTLQDFLAKREALNCLERKRNNSFKRPRRNDEKVKKIYKQIMSYFFEDFKAQYFGVAPRKDPVTFTIDVNAKSSRGQNIDNSKVSNHLKKLAFSNSRNKNLQNLGQPQMTNFSYAFRPNEMELCFYAHYFGHLCKPKVKFLPERVPCPNINHSNMGEQERRWSEVGMPKKDITARARALIEIGPLPYEKQANFMVGKLGPNHTQQNNISSSRNQKTLAGEGGALSFKEYQHQQRSGKKAPSVISKKSRRSRKSIKPSKNELERLDSFFDPIKNKLRNLAFRSFKPDYFRHLLRAGKFREGVVLYLGEGIVGGMLGQYSAELGKKMVKRKFCLLEMQKKKSKFFWNRFEVIVALEHFKKKFCRDILVLPSPKGDISFSMRIMQEIKLNQEMKFRANQNKNENTRMVNQIQIQGDRQVGVRLRDIPRSSTDNLNSSDLFGKSSGMLNSETNNMLIEEESQGRRGVLGRSGGDSQRFGPETEGGAGTMGGHSRNGGFFGSEFSMVRVDTGSLRPDKADPRKTGGSKTSFAFEM